MSHIFILPADRSGPAAVLRELLLHVRQPDVLASQHDDGHEHGERRTRLCASHQRITVTMMMVLPRWFCIFFLPENVFSDGNTHCLITYQRTFIVIRV